MHCGERAQRSKWSRHAYSTHRKAQGFTYLAVLVALMLISLATNGVMTYVSQQAQREREADLLRIGQAYMQAIGAYYEASPGSVKRWPLKLEELLDDRRQVSIQRHLRMLYPDPMTHQVDWDLIRTNDGAIKGVRSHSALFPIRTSAIALDQTTLAPASRYSDWEFVYQPMQLSAIPGVVK